jgi:PTH2 family peptidyl-tRNA hydrolase
VSGDAPDGAVTPPEDKIQQTIVLRTDLNMRKGKMVAQGAHASLAFLAAVHRGEATATPDMEEWLREKFTKVCLGVGSEEELDRVYDAARAAGLPVYRIVDSGLTEFHGVPTKTCLAIGPARKSAIDPVTRDLKLL